MHRVRETVNAWLRRVVYSSTGMAYSIMTSSCMSATDSADKESFIYKTFSSHLLQTPHAAAEH